MTVASESVAEARGGVPSFRLWSAAIGNMRRCRNVTGETAQWHCQHEETIQKKKNKGRHPAGQIKNSQEPQATKTSGVRPGSQVRFKRSAGKT